MQERERWTWRSNPKRFIITMAVVTVIAVLVGTGIGLIAEEAEGTGKTSPSQTSTQRCVSSADAGCTTIRKRDRRAARKFRNDRIDHAHGFRPAKVFKKPRVARKIFVTKIRRVLIKANQSGRVVARGDNPYAGCTSRGCALEIYNDLREKSGCAAFGGPYPTDTDTCTMNSQPGTRPFTKEEIQTGGTAVLCGGGVVIGVMTSGASAGTTTFAAIWGATACGWSFWSAID